VVVKSLAGVGTVQRVEIVGTAGALAFRREVDGLHVTIPDGASHDYGIALKISGDRLT
jgi:alpha-L-fucosidase